MLLRFGVSNFRSINERQELSMIADGSIKDSKEGLIEIDNNSLKETVLPAALIYGANASGKTSLIQAFETMCLFVMSCTNTQYIETIYDPFRLDDEIRDKPSSFDIDFIVDGIRYHYGFSISKSEVTEEYLYAFPQGKKRKLYERRGNLEGIDFGSSLGKKPRDIEQRTRKDVLFLTTAYQFNYPVFRDIWSWLIVTMQIPTNASERKTLERFFDPAIIPFLRDIGTGIEEYRFVEIHDNIEVSKSQLVPTFRVREKSASILDIGYINNGKIQFGHKTKSEILEFFDLEMESLGTRRIAILLVYALKAIKNGSPLFIDELDASLHTKLAEKIIQLFQNKATNPNGAQLIATTHDTNLLSSAHLRRDQIWFTEKNPEQATQLYPLTDFNTRKEGNIEKGYLDGRYGAIPYGGSITSLFSK